MLLANKFFDLVIGIDFHATASPPFNPIHPFIGFTLDISAYIPMIGATTFINKVPYGNSGTMGTLGTKAHIPLVGGFVMAPMIANESTNFFGSMNTFVEGMRLSGAGFMVMSCNDVGLPLSMQPGTKGKKFKPSLFAPTSVTIPIPKGSPVMVGGPYVPDLTAVLKSLAMGFGMGCLMKGLGGSAKKIAKLANAKNKQARDLMSGIVNDTPLPRGKVERILKAGTPEHKTARWKSYCKKNNKMTYEEWSNRYDANMKNANKGNKAADEYQKQIGWGDREVSMKNQDGKVIRKIDIADVENKKAVEVKNYASRNVSLSNEIKKEVEFDKGLAKDGWDVEWVFTDRGPSKSLEKLLSDPPPIKIVH